MLDGENELRAHQRAPDAEVTSMGLDTSKDFFHIRQRRVANSSRTSWRIGLCFAVGVALICAVCSIITEQNSAEGLLDGADVLLSEKLDTSTDLVSNDDSKKASRRRLEAKAKSTDNKILTSSEREALKTNVKTLLKEEKTNEKSEQKLNDEILKKTASLKQLLLKARHVRLEGNILEKDAKEKVDEAAKHREQAQNLRHESDAAKRRFLAEERPIQLAMKLEGHDQRSYRKIQLLIAKDVTLLSEHPEDDHLRSTVEKLIASSKADKRRVAEDERILGTLQERTADASLEGSHGYTALKHRSVEEAKLAEKLAKEAVKLAAKGHKDREDATKLVVRIKAKMVGPDSLHAQAHRVLSKERSEATKIKRARKKLEAASNAADEALANKLGSHDHREDKYDRDREELEKAVLHGNSKRSGASHEDHRKEARKGRGTSQTAAEADYNRMEEEALQAERLKSRMERQHRAELERDNDDEQSLAQKPNDAALRAHIVSRRQSTFLMGLLSNKAPWDTDHDRA